MVGIDGFEENERARARSRCAQLWQSQARNASRVRSPLCRCWSQRSPVPSLFTAKFANETRGQRDMSADTPVDMSGREFIAARPGRPLGVLVRLAGLFSAGFLAYARGTCGFSWAPHFAFSLAAARPRRTSRRLRKLQRAKPS